MTAAGLSIPRDLWVSIPGLGTEGKINTAHFLGDAEGYPGGGPALAQAAVQALFDVPQQYYVRVNFTAFEKLIDLIGGIDVDVPYPIDDPLYPDSGYGYEPLTIPAGRIHMDGRLALKYARTRHEAMGDFDRMQRQQQVIMAVRDKATSIGQIGKVPEVLNVVGDALRTDLTLPEILALAKKWTQIPRENIHAYRIDETLVTPWVTPQGGQVLLPDREKIAGVVAEFLGQSGRVANMTQP